METKSLEQKITEEITKHRFSPYELPALLNIAKTNSVVTDLFKQFEGNEKLFRLMTLHRLDLFGIETEVKTTLFLYCNLPKTVTGGNKGGVSNALEFIIKEKIEKTEENGLSLFNHAVGNIEGLSMDFKDIACYFLIDFFRHNPNLLELANAEGFDFKSMKEKVKDYEGTIEFESYFTKKTGNYTENVDSEIRKKIERIALQVAANITSKVEQTIDGLNKVAPDLTLYFHKQSILWLTLLLERTEFSIDEYTQCLDTLFRIKAIQNKHIVTWCENCNKHEPSFQIITGKIAPSNLTGKKECIQCQNKKHYSFSAIYSLESGLKDIVNSKDGVLATYLSWLADKKGMTVECSTYAGPYETDILINKKYLVECKNFKVEKDESAMLINAKKSFSQLEKQINKFKTEGIIIERAYLLWNLDVDDKDLREALETTFRSQRQQYGFEVIPYYEVEEFVKTLQ